MDTMETDRLNDYLRRREHPAAHMERDRRAELSMQLVPAATEQDLTRITHCNRCMPTIYAGTHCPVRTGVGLPQS